MPSAVFGSAAVITVLVALTIVAAPGAALMPVHVPCMLPPTIFCVGNCSDAPGGGSENNVPASCFLPPREIEETDVLLVPEGSTVTLWIGIVWKLRAVILEGGAVFNLTRACDIAVTACFLVGQKATLNLNSYSQNASAGRGEGQPSRLIVTAWYFSATALGLDNDDNGVEGGKQKGTGVGTMCRAFCATLRYHLGTILFGSLLIAIVQFTRAVMLYIQKNQLLKKPDRRPPEKSQIAYVVYLLKVDS